MLWTILAIVLVLWLLGFIGGIGGGLIQPAADPRGDRSDRAASRRAPDGQRPGGHHQRSPTV